MYVFFYKIMYLYLYLFIHTNTYICTYIYICTHIYIHIHTNIYIYNIIHIYIYIYVQCAKYNKEISVRLRPDVLHSHNSSAGYLDLDGVKASQVSAPPPPPLHLFPPSSLPLHRLLSLPSSSLLPLLAFLHISYPFVFLPSSSFPAHDRFMHSQVPLNIIGLFCKRAL